MMNPIKTIAISLALVMYVLPAQGQEPDLDDTETLFGQAKSGGLGYFMAGTHMLNVGNLNTALSNAGYPELSGNMISIGGGGHGMSNRWMLGGHGHFIQGRSEETGSYDISLGGGYGFLDLGYQLFTPIPLDIYPMVGVGLGGVTLDISENQSQSFNDLLNNPDSKTQINNGGWLVDVSMNVTYIIDMSDLPSEQSGWSVGLKAGYIWDPGNNPWMANGNELADGPEMNLSGFYVTLMIGGGGFLYDELPIQKPD